MTINRRSLLKAAAAAMPAAMLPRASMRAMSRALNDIPAANTNARMLTIFLRGGNDGLNTFCPLLDPDYYNFRTNISLATSNSGNRKCELVPRYPSLGMHRSLSYLRTLMNQPGGGGVAALQRVGNFEAQRSHFTEQHLFETGLQDFQASAEGWVPQMLPQLGSTALMPAVSESNRNMRLYFATGANKPTTHLQGAYSSGATRQIDVPFAEPGTPGSIVARAVRFTTDPNTTAYPVVGSSAFLRESTNKAIDTLAALRNSPDITHDNDRYPSLAGANVTWSLSKYAQFFDRLEESVAYLKRGQANFVGVELGGWDTHGGQLTAQDELLAVLDRAIRGAHLDLDSGSDPYLIFVVTEFGRTARDNGNPSPTVQDNGAGTDHGVGGLFLAIGSTVNGGVYNMSHPTWTQDPLAPTGVANWDFMSTTPTTGRDANALVPVTDFRVPFIEIANKFYGFNATQIGNFDSVGTEWQAILQNQTPVENQLLGFL